MKCIKKILAICSFAVLLTGSNCFAVTLDNTDITEDELYCYKTYSVQENEKETFLQMLDKEIEIEGNKYSYIDFTSEGGNTTDTIDITTSKKILSKTNNITDIINQLGTTISYSKDGYVGEYLLNTDNIKITTNYNGFREDLIEETINYTNLERNDLDFLPKQTVKDGLTLDLLNIEWEVETTKMIGEYEVPHTYTAKCYYAGKQRIDYPNTYNVTAEYSGTATKTIENPTTYIVKYEKQENEEVKTEPVPEVVEKKENNLLPVVGGTTGIIVLVIFFLTGNVTVYNLRDGKYKKVGKVRINKNNTINLTRFSLTETTNKYKLEFSKRLTDKKQKEMITVVKGNAKVQMLVNTDDEKYQVEIRI